MSRFLPLLWLWLSELYLEGGIFLLQNSSWIQVLDSLKIVNYFYQNPKECTLISERLGFSHFFGLNLMINFCSRFPNLSKSILFSTNGEESSEWAFGSSLKGATSQGQLMAQAQSVSYSEENISPVVLLSLTLFLALVLSLLLGDFYSKQTMGAVLFNNLK